MLFFKFNTKNSNSPAAGLIGKIFSDFTLLLTKMDVLSVYMSNIINAESTEKAIEITNKFFDVNTDIEHLREQFIADVKYFKSSIVDLEKQQEAGHDYAFRPKNTDCDNCNNCAHCNTSDVAADSVPIQEDTLPTKKATDNDYIRIIKNLIDTNNSTTNLDIKNALRAEGFYATQEDVSKSMNFIHEQYSDFLSMNYENISGKTVKVWSKGNDYNSPVNSYIKNSIFQTVNVTNPLDWVVSHKSDRFSTEIVDGNMTRDQARSYFAKKNGYNRDFVRAIRYKNHVNKSY